MDDKAGNYSVPGCAETRRELSWLSATSHLEQEFHALRRKWHQERKRLPFVSDMIGCPSYRAIVDLGPDVVPVILRQLEQEGDEPDFWFSALKTLTKADPVPEEDRGRMRRMAAAWIDWGKRQDAAH